MHWLPAQAGHAPPAAAPPERLLRHSSTSSRQTEGTHGMSGRGMCQIGSYSSGTHSWKDRVAAAQQASSTTIASQLRKGGEAVSPGAARPSCSVTVWKVTTAASARAFSANRCSQNTARRRGALRRAIRAARPPPPPSTVGPASATMQLRQGQLKLRMAWVGMSRHRYR